MKLYLSSYGLGDNPEELQSLVGNNKRVAVIINAQDSADTEKRAERVRLGFEEMNSLGFKPEELDLRDYFDQNEKLISKLGEYGLLWIRGGNAFNLMRAMKQSGFTDLIGPLLQNEQLVYAGFSAASCVAGPSLHGIELVDDDSDVPEGYIPEVVWEGLNLIPYSIAPHYRSEHPESEAIEKTVEYFEERGMPYKTLRDGQTIVIAE